MDVDLHIHSSVSDGVLSPAEIVKAASVARLDAIALADHDTVLGVREAQAAAEVHPVEVVPAIEVSASHPDLELHILGYFVDPGHAELVSHVEEATSRRESRMQEMVSRLGEQGVEISFDAVRRASANRGTLGRPHLARALVEAGHVGSANEAFDRFIGNAHSAYIPTRLVDPHQAIGLIERAGGVAIWAHPPARQVSRLLPELIESGLRGIEVYRPRTPRARVLELERAAEENDLLVSGGSDWHGPEQGPLGEFRVQASEVSELLAEGGI